jgi:hypothetical protein
MMKLGSQTNSLVNHIQSRATIGQPVPEVGMGATILAWTDRYPATIVEVQVIKGRTYVTVQEDRAKMISGDYYNPGEYEYTRNPEASFQTWRTNDKGFWEGTYFNPKTKRWVKNPGNGLRIGDRDKYHDPSF